MPSSAIPPAPPLPPQKPPSSTARSAFARFVTQPFSAYGSRPASAQANRADVGRAAAIAPRITGITSLASQDASLQISSGTEITALDVNLARTHAVIAGRDILQTIRVNGTTCVEDTNLRTVASERDRQRSARHRATLDIHDVKWSHGQFSNYIAAAATNGKVVLYDLNRPGIEIARLHEHHRQVHCLSISPFLGFMLLSGSQDATVRLWDLRDTRSEVMICHSRQKFMGQSDGIRDVSWSPKDGVEFAFGTDNGVVQAWDYRNAKSPKVRINAHEKACTAIDWHPDGTHLLSASQDKTVSVWDVSTSIKRPKPLWTLRAPYPVLKARWRPPCWTKDIRSQGAWQCTQIATSYERLYPTVHVWDFRRIHMPFREILNMDTAPTDFLWHSQDLLWFVNREGKFHQVDVQYAHKVIDRRPLQALAVSPTGELCVFSQGRGITRKHERDYAQENDETNKDKGSGTASEKTQLSRSSFDDSVDDNFLSSSYKGHHERRPSNRTAKSLGSTPPSIKESGVIKLDETLREGKCTFTPDQVAYRMTLDGTMDSLVFSYLAQKYKGSNALPSLTLDSIEGVEPVFEQNAAYAQRTGLYRLAQSWRLFGSAMQSELLQNEREKGSSRQRDLQRKVFEALNIALGPTATLKTELANVPEIDRLRDLQWGGQKLDESSSNVPTPLAKPYGDSPSSTGLGSGTLPDPDEEGQLALPASLSPQAPLQYLPPAPHQESSNSQTLEQARSRFEEPQWYTSVEALQERRAGLSSWRAPPKSPLHFDTPSSRTTAAINIPPPLDRHNSDESFAMFSASSESQRASSVPASFKSSRSMSISMRGIPENDDMSIHARNIGNENPTNLTTSFESMDSNTPSTYLTGSSESNVLVGPLDVTQSRNQDARSLLSSAIPNRPHSDDTQGKKKYLSLADVRRMVSEGSLDKSFEDNLKAAIQDYSDKLNDPEPSQRLGMYGRLNKAIPPLKGILAAEEEIRKHENRAFHVKALLENAFEYYTNKQVDPQFLVHVIDLLKPCLAPGHEKLHDESHKAIDEIVEQLTQHTGDLEAFANCFGSKICNLEWAGVPQTALEAVWTTYVELLERHQCYSALVIMKKAGMLFQSFAEENYSLDQRSKIGFLCSRCDKPINSPDKPLRCDKCSALHQPCPVCWMVKPPEPLPGKRSKKADAPTSGSLLEFCMVCGHCAHPGCWAMVQSDPVWAGHCVIPECDCPCKSGLWRNKVAREEEEVKGVRGVIRGEERKVGESKAVEGARRLLESRKTVAFLDEAGEEE